MISKGRVTRIGLIFAIFNFILTAALGVLVRYHTVSPIADFVERYWIHAHSHTGFLGWAFLALITFAYAMMIAKSARINRRMYRLLIYLQVSIIGMVVTYPFVGYAAPSILFSTFHMILSLLFVILFYRNSNGKELPVRFMRAGLIFMLISGIGPLALGPMMVMGMKGTAIYDMAVYFYLHFQYNGWFVLAVFGLFIMLIKNLGFPMKESKGKMILHLTIYAVILTLASSALGFSTHWAIRLLSLLGAILQLWVGFILLKLILTHIHLARSVRNTIAKWFFGIALLAWLLKIMLQFISVIPVVTDFAYFNRDAIMAFLHLTFLGFVSCFLIGLMIIQNHLTIANRAARIGYWLFLLSVVAMEMMISLKAFPQILSFSLFQSTNLILLVASIGSFLSLSIILFYGFLFPKKKMIT